MKYQSTRGGEQDKSSAQAIWQGLSKDGGLFVPDCFPPIAKDGLEFLSKMDYAHQAEAILGLYLTDFTKEELHMATQKAYAKGRFDTPHVAPMVTLSDNLSVLELWHGPTLAFKDIALQILPRLLPLAMKKIGTDKDAFILVATSGDTGKAALEGFCEVAGTRIMVFYPEEGVSPTQKLQMVTQKGNNVAVCAVKGNFDDAQNGVKAIFSDDEFARQVEEKGFSLSSANSINWGRLVPQIAYYFSSYGQLLRNGQIALGDGVNFVVPTGNFGNILAGYYAKQMGLPIKKLICASNNNHVLTDFIMTDVYNKNRLFHKTSSPSMDILISSNLERLLYELSDRDADHINRFMAELKQGGVYSVYGALGDKLRDNFYGAYVSEQGTQKAIAACYAQYGYVMDPHTAVAFGAYQQYMKETQDSTPSIIISTASAYKFSQSVVTAIQGKAAKDEEEAASLVEKWSGAAIPQSVATLGTQPILHKDSVVPSQMRQMVTQFLK